MEFHMLATMLELLLLRSVKSPASLAKIKPFCKDIFDAMKTVFADDPDFQ